ncbi:hypothetical protein ACVW2L_001910 [Mucilaginibacter sp. HD30]
MQGAINNEEEVLLNVWIPKSVLTDIKSFGLEKDLSVKDITIDALKLYLNFKLKQS